MALRLTRETLTDVGMPVVLPRNEPPAHWYRVVDALHGLASMTSSEPRKAACIPRATEEPARHAMFPTWFRP
jgi:hypothetical protein